MYEIAEQVLRWLADGREVRVAQVIATRGFSSRDPSAALAWTDGATPVGVIGSGIEAATLSGLPIGISTLAVSDEQARAAGLSCGGHARVLVRRATDRDEWERLVRREPLCLVTQLAAGAEGPDGAGATAVYTPATIRDAGASHHDQVPRLFGRGTSATELIEGPDGSATAVVVLWPVPTLVVVGDGLIADALAGAASLLGWHAFVTNEVDAAVAAARDLHTSDAFVVLSHSRNVDGPTLAAALATQVGYVGALGSRRTQAARREWLTDHGVDGGAQERVHGPAGLDIDAHAPGEIAVSIVAEIIASRGQSSGGALRDREGPVHLGGVNAPPPRYPATAP